MLSSNSDIRANDMYSTQGPAVPRRRVPSPGERACGHGVDGVVATVPASQPLAADGVWRVTLVGETCGRLVSATPDGGWHLLHLGELSEAQLDALEAGTATLSLC
jgi:hypothetical protein